MLARVMTFCNSLTLPGQEYETSKYIQQFLTDNNIEFQAGFVKTGIVAHIKGIDNRDLSINLIGQDLYIKQDQLPKLDDGKHYWYELVGFKVINQNQNNLGVVDYLVDTGSNNVMVTKGEKEHWIPYIKPFLLSIDKDNKEILVDWDEDF